MFSYGPFFHTGVKAEASFGKSGFMLGVANPTDLKSTSFGKKFVVGQYSVATKDDKLKAYLNFQGGKFSDSIKITQFDAVVTAAITSKFSIGVNGTMAHFSYKPLESEFDYSSGSWWGSRHLSECRPGFVAGPDPRTEYFSDEDQLNVFSAMPGRGQHRCYYFVGQF